VALKGLIEYNQMSIHKWNQTNLLKFNRVIGIWLPNAINQCNQYV